jgi:phosphotransferase system  glucose/maltose/N-acetylglucosamine-specific IIC component
MLKYLRIAVTALSLTTCVLLCALWVRSYYRLDTMMAWPSHTVSSIRGRIFIDARFIHVESSGAQNVFWFYAGTSIPIDDGAAFKSQTAGTPIWLLALVAATLAAVSCARFSKRYSLRTLLIAITLVAVGLGIIAMSS